MGEKTEPDYFGYVDDLRWALELPEVKAALEHGRPLAASEAVQQWQSLPSAVEPGLDPTGPYWFASALGFCRIAGIALPPDVAPTLEHPLPVGVLAAALRGLIHALEHLTADARELPERFDDAEPVEDVALCTSILHQLMQTWAAFIAINEGYQEYLNAGGSPSSEFGRLMGEILDAFDRVDEVTQGEEQLQLLSTTAELPVLENLRNMLQGPFREILPWWLDGTLGPIVDEQSGRSALSDLLVIRNEEINANGREYSLAASSKGPLRPQEEVLLKTRWPVHENPRISVRFWLDASEGSHRRLRLQIVGAAEHKSAFRSAEVLLPGGATRSAPLLLGEASFELEPTEIPIGAAALLDANGNRARIMVGTPSNGEK